DARDVGAKEKAPCKLVAIDQQVPSAAAGARRPSEGGRSPPPSSIGIRESPIERLNEDLHVEEERPALDVVEIVFDPLLQRRSAAPAVHLRPAGHPRLDLVAEHVAGNPAPEVVDEDRTLGPRADEAHL